MPIRPDPEQLRRWRLVLGKDAQAPIDGMGGSALTGGDSEMDEALAAIYDEVPDEETPKQRTAGLGGSAPRLAKWLGDIRTYFPAPTVRVMQQDALDRLNRYEAILWRQVRQILIALDALDRRKPQNRKRHFHLGNRQDLSPYEPEEY